MREKLTQKVVKEYLDYFPETGRFFLKKKRSKSDVIGKELKGFHPKWGYSRITIEGQRYYAHRIAWIYFYGKEPDGLIDHINGDRKDN